MRRCFLRTALISAAGRFTVPVYEPPRLYSDGHRAGNDGFRASPSPSQPRGSQGFTHRNASSSGSSNPSSGRSHERSSHRPHHHHQSNRNRGGPVKDRYPPITVDLADPRRRLAVLVDGSNVNLLGGCLTKADLLTHSNLFTNVLPAVLTVGVPVLLRVFAHQLPAEWEPLMVPNSSSPSSSSSSSSSYAGVVAINDLPATGAGGARDASGTGTGGGPNVVALPSSNAAGATATSDPRILVEYFRVERFIPIPMQMEADARHIYDFRHQNKIEGVCYTCHEVDRALYEAVMAQQLRQDASPSSATTEHGTDFFNQYLFDELGPVKEVVVDGRSQDGS